MERDASRYRGVAFLAGVDSDQGVYAFTVSPHLALGRPLFGGNDGWIVAALGVAPASAAVFSRVGYSAAASATDWDRVYRIFFGHALWCGGSEAPRTAESGGLDGLV